MDSLPSAVSLARALLSLARSRRTGVLHIAAARGSCRIAIVDGVPRAASGPAELERPLGDVLIDEGELDPRAHAAALAAGMRECGPVGRWLLDAGLVSKPALELALRRQLQERVLFVFGCPGLDYHFTPGAADVGVPLIAEPVGTADLVLAAMRAQVAPLSVQQLHALIDGGELRLSALGAMLVREAALWPEEAAAAALLAEGTTLARVLGVTNGAERALRLLAALSLLSGLSSAPSRERRFSLIVRKREQVRRAAPANALLELPPGAGPGDARRALRRLASALHPDTLGAAAPEALRRASSEVLSSLIAAEQALLSSRAPRSHERAR